MNRERWDWKFPEGFPKKHQLLVVLLVGILLVIIAIPTPKPGESLEKERTSEADDRKTTDLDTYRRCGKGAGDDYVSHIGRESRGERFGEKRVCKTRGNSV